MILYGTSEVKNVNSPYVEVRSAGSPVADIANWSVDSVIGS